MAAREVRAELLLGRPVLGPGGRVDAHLEEIILEPAGEDYVVREYLAGPEGFMEEWLDFAPLLPLVRLLSFPRRVLRRRPIRWEWLDLTDPEHPRLRVPERDDA